MATTRTYTPDLLPELALPEDLAEQGLYKPAGVGCEHCEFTTKKTGFSGRQALRAHFKKHRYDERAWRGPLLRQGLVAGVILVLVMIVLTPVMAAKAGMVRLLVKRRGVRSGSYSTLVSPKDKLASAEAWLLWKSRRAKNAAGRE